jgi:hypothetical protein
MKSLHVPARVMSYMADTGWGQEAEAVTDSARVRLLSAFRHRDKRGGYTLHEWDDLLLARLVFEADHCADSWRYGDHDNDTYADFRAAMKLIDAIAQIDPTIVRRHREVLFG